MTIFNGQDDRDDETALETRPTASLDFGGGADLDVQIATAKKYPRSIDQFIKRATAMATLDEDTATECFYALPRDGKRINGPSARLAEICAAAWGNLCIAARVTGDDSRFVYSVGAAWDMENNVKIAFEARRRITNRSNQRYNEDMIATTGNAASSIALRNAVFKAIPKAFWGPIFQQCMKVAVGDGKTLAARRAKMLDHFQKTMAVDSVRVFSALGVRGIEDVNLEHLETLIGLANAIRDGDTTPEEAFPAVAVDMPKRASEKPSESKPPATGDADDRPGVQPPPELPKGATRIVSIDKKDNFWLGVTVEGTAFYSFSDKVPWLSLVEQKTPIVPTYSSTDRDWKGRKELTSIQVVKA